MTEHLRAGHRERTAERRGEEPALVRSAYQIILRAQQRQAIYAGDRCEDITQHRAGDGGHVVGVAGENLEHVDAAGPQGRDVMQRVGPDVSGQTEIDVRAPAEMRQFLLQFRGCADRPCVSMLDNPSRGRLQVESGSPFPPFNPQPNQLYLRA
ncbi:MAG TPA: hypothetical protein DEP84_31990 [Chloroflexi bacterium]|nr:hypothetical protein [Chloroflexota bacterium]